MYRLSVQGVYERMINVHYYYYYLVLLLLLSRFGCEGKNSYVCVQKAQAVCATDARSRMSTSA